MRSAATINASTVQGIGSEYTRERNARWGWNSDCCGLFKGASILGIVWFNKPFRQQGYFHRPKHDELADEFKYFNLDEFKKNFAHKSTHVTFYKVKQDRNFVYQCTPVRLNQTGYSDQDYCIQKIIDTIGQLENTSTPLFKKCFARLPISLTQNVSLTYARGRGTYDFPLGEIAGQLQYNFNKSLQARSFAPLRQAYNSSEYEELCYYDWYLQKSDPIYSDKDITGCRHDWGRNLIPAMRY